MTLPNSLRIAIVSWSSRRVGGVEEYLSMLIPALHDAGNQVAFWHETDAPANRDRITIPSSVIDICAAELGTNAAVDALRQWKPDVIYAHGLRDPQLEGRLQRLAPAIMFLHSYSGTCISGGKTFTRPQVTPCDRAFGWPCLVQYFPRGCGGRSPITMWRQFGSQSTRLAVMRSYQSILTHTAHMQAEMAKHGLYADVVPYAVNAQASVAGTTPVEGKWRLLFAGRMEFLKGTRLLLDALPIVAAATRRSIETTLAGDGTQRNALEMRAREIAAPNVSTRFVGWVDKQGIDSLTDDIDLLVVPSVWPEPFGSVGPAAAQRGVPAAAFDVGGISGWLTEGVSGHLAPADPPTSEGLARAIISCLEDPAHYTALRAGAREMADRFTMSQHLPVLMAAMERAAAR
jgi:glycosyltransferase involved in cell wall biosynthesis